MGALYFLTSMIGAFLVFMIQPLAAKWALPVLGGSPSVWNSTMLFFQTLLLMGYLYAHLSTHLLGVRRQSLLHMVFMALSLLAFPLIFGEALGIDPAADPIRWLMVMLLLSVGIPYFITSSSAPLLQKWLAHTDSRHAANPYFLYVGSNIGSLVGLLCYPTIMEPWFSLHRQAEIYMAGYVLLILCFCFVAYRLHRYYSRADQNQSAAVETAVDIKPSSRRIAWWILLSFLPSSLLYGVTAHITTDIASVPLLWVLPLSLYLITFILLFGNKPLGYKLSKACHIPLVFFTVATIATNLAGYSWLALVQLAAFFFSAMFCHGLLVESRPSPRFLTAFYLWMSFGGMLGGIFNTFIAPHLFTTTVLEYPIMLLATVLLRVNWHSWKAGFNKIEVNRRFLLRKLLPDVLLLAAVIIFTPMIADYFGSPELDPQVIKGSIYVSVGLLLLLMIIDRTSIRTDKVILVFSALLLLLLGIGRVWQPFMKQDLLFVDRNFFGVSRVFYMPRSNAHFLYHGTTAHGMQSLDETQRLDPVSYYAALREVFESLSSQVTENPAAVLGLGAGTIACYGKADQRFDMFEIDPAIIKIAQDPTLFTYMRDCPPQKQIIFGDARLKLTEQAPSQYGIMVMDAFSSDAIPVHLMTYEAVEMYFSKLAPHGLMAFNISNRHLDLLPVLSAIGNKLGVPVVHKFFINEDNTKPLVRSAHWVVLARTQEDIAPLLAKEGWSRAPAADAGYLWTDTYSNLLGTVKSFNPNLK